MVQAAAVAVVRRDRDREEAAVVRHQRAVLLQRQQHRLLLHRVVCRNNEARAQPQPLAHRWCVRIRGAAYGGSVRGRINRAQPRVRHHQPHRMLHHAALALVIPHQRREHRQPRRIAGGPARRAQGVGGKAELRPVRGLPRRACQLRQPRFPQVARARHHRDRVPVAALVRAVLLPLGQCERPCSHRPGLHRQVRRDGIQAVGRGAAVQVRFIRVVDELHRLRRLRIRHQHEVHLRKQPQVLAVSPLRRQVALDLRDHRRAVREQRQRRNILVPGVVHRHDLHGRGDRIRRRRVEQRRRRHHRCRAQKASLVVDSLGAVGGHRCQGDQTKTGKSMI